MRLSPQRLERVVGDVGFCELLGRAHQDPRDIDGDVAHADHRGALSREIERVVTIIGVPVVPGHEFRGRVAAQEVLARYAHPAVRLGAGRKQHLVVVLLQIGQREVRAEVDVTEEPEARVAPRLRRRPG